MGLLGKILTLPGIIVALSFHEFAHAWVSFKLGDPTPARQGRLTINPIAHIDWMGFITLMLFGFGWGKPVMIDPYYYKNRRRDELLVGLAGVTMNLILAIIFSFPTKWLYSLYVSTGSSLIEMAYFIFYYTVMINLCLMIFNLIPCPPLDGFGIATQLFNLEKYDWYYKFYRIGPIILIGLILFNVTNPILTACINFFMGILL